MPNTALQRDLKVSGCESLDKKKKKNSSKQAESQRVCILDHTASCNIYDLEHVT